MIMTNGFNLQKDTDGLEHIMTFLININKFRFNLDNDNIVLFLLVSILKTFCLLHS